MERRNRLNIIYDILGVIQKKGEIKKTHIMYQANLSHNQLKLYLNELYKKKFIENTDSEKPLIKMTKKDHLIKDHYTRLMELEAKYRTLGDTKKADYFLQKAEYFLKLGEGNNE